MVCPPVREIIYSLKLVDYLVQADNHGITTTCLFPFETDCFLQQWGEGGFGGYSGYNKIAMSDRIFFFFFKREGWHSFVESNVVIFKCFALLGGHHLSEK